MNTALKSLRVSSSKLPRGCVLPKLKSLFVDQATRQAGRSLYEILGVAELMRVAYEKGELEALQQRLKVLLSDAAALSATLSTIIELAQTEYAEPVVREFDLVALLNEAAESARDLIGQKQVTIMAPALPGPVVVRSDPRKVRRIMIELASNAVKFTDKGRIALILAGDDDSVRVMVTDTGKGMSGDEIDLLRDSGNHGFDGEVRTDTPGLGLRMVRHLVRSLGGEIAVSSRIGEGTIVEITLPLLPEPAIRA